MKKIVLIALSIFCFYSMAFGDTIEVSSPDMTETKKIELRPDQTATLTVYLKSSGEPFGGLQVALLPEKENHILRREPCDDNGVAVFDKLSPGKYRVLLAITRERRVRTTLSVADAALTLTDKTAAPVANH